MNAISEIGAELKEEFEMFDDPMDKYEYIIELGKSLPAMDEALKTDDRLVKGCQSKVWLDASYKDGLVKYTADSNTVITKGIIAILVRLLSNQKPETIVAEDLNILKEIDLRNHLSSQRSNGLTSMINQMKQYANVFCKLQQ